MAAQNNQEIQLSKLVEATRPRVILSDARTFFNADFPKAPFNAVVKAFTQTKRLYDGRYRGYQACAVEYHDYAHSVAVFGATSRHIDGCELAGLSVGPGRAAETLIAALLHDTGYIREEGDHAGTGAQYTKVHVDRSAAFARREAASFGLEPEAAERVARIILATDLARPWSSLVFMDETERLCGEILAAADIIGQMADRAYLEKLLFLFYEFQEAGIGGYESAFDILRKTAGFYESTKARLDGPLGRVSGRSREHFAARYGVDRDLYREAIQRQMDYLDSILADNSTNFRTKLKRIDFAAVEGRRA
jgi:hypothetical protein